MKILLIAEGDTDTEALADLLMEQGFPLDMATDAAMGLALARTYAFDLVVLDAVQVSPRIFGLCRQLRGGGFRGMVLLLVPPSQPSDRIEGLNAGADGYITKPYDSQELLARIRAMLRQTGAIATTVITWENLRFDPIHNEVSAGGKRLHLTPKEYCLLELFLLNPRRVFSRRAILDRLWDFVDSPGEETVSTHIKCLRQKLKAAGVNNLIDTVHGVGYRLQDAAVVQETEAVLNIPSAVGGKGGSTRTPVERSLGVGQLGASLAQRVLLVDEDASWLQAIARVLEQSNFQVEGLQVGGGPGEELESGGVDLSVVLGKLISSLERVQPHLLGLNLELRSCDALELCRQVCQHPVGRTVPLVVLAATVDLAVLDLAFAAGSAGFVYRAQSINQVGDRLCRYLIPSGIASTAKAWMN